MHNAILYVWDDVLHIIVRVVIMCTPRRTTASAEDDMALISLSKTDLTHVNLSITSRRRCDGIITLRLHL